MKCTFDQIVRIVKENPNKKRIEEGRRKATKLQLHLYGRGMDSALVQCEYFENKDVYSIRKQYAVSNKDLFGRVLQQEDMVFSAKGGSSFFNMPEEPENQMGVLLGEIRYGMPLRKWIRNFALQAYRSDPMSIIFMEVERTNPDSPERPRTYPTYKSIFCIYDYETTGRRLEYVCFELTPDQVRSFGINDPELKGYIPENKTFYYRFVDDEKDIILKYKANSVFIVGEPITDLWNVTPGFITSDLMQFDDPGSFLSPLDLTIELADSFLTDRSVRDLQKRYHGFSKAVEPLLTCPTCAGTGTVQGSACPDCSSGPNAQLGTGYKMQTKVSDVARFPMELFEKGSFDFKRIFGYVTPDIEGWRQQDLSLDGLEHLVNMTYWGTGHAQQANGPTGVKPGHQQSETATKTLDDRQPRYARLNQTAEWAEKTEMLIADFVGRFWFSDSFKKSSIAYGRYYILETPDELRSQYQELRTKGAPQTTLYEAMEKYYHSVYQNSPVELAVRLKLLYVEPFPHMGLTEAKTAVTDLLDFNSKVYFGEWYSTLKDMLVITTPTEQLRKMLREYVQKKNIPAPTPPVLTSNN